MNDVQPVAAGAGGHLLLLGGGGGVSLYNISAAESICRILPNPREPQCAHAVGGPVRQLAVLGETPLIAFTLDGSLPRPQETFSFCAAKSTDEQQQQQQQQQQKQQQKPKHKPHGPSAESVPTATSRVLHLYDASQQRFLAELHFKTAVVGVRLNCVRLAVALETCVHVFDLRTLRHIAELRTTTPRNPHGIIALSEPTTNVRGEPVSYLAVPQSDCEQGDVSVTQISQSCGDASAENAGNARARAVERVANLSAHKCNVACIAMTRDGMRLATASVRGTTVKVFETATARPLFVFRRGLTPARMLSLAFDADGQRIAALSTRGTLHVFRCASTAGYFGGEERSFAQVALRQPAARECFFADDGRTLWVALSPSPGEQMEWELQQYAINGSACQLHSTHTVHV